MTIAVIVPVMRRPHHAEPFMHSFRDSSPDATVYAVTDPEDHDTRVAWQAAGARILVSDRGFTFSNKVQYGYLNTVEPWLLLVGDDVHFHPGWDTAALAAAGDEFHLVATNDMGNPWVMWGKHATHPVIRRSYVDERGNTFDGTPGVIAFEGYRHAWVDNEWSVVALRRGVFVFAEESRIEHLHPTWGKGRLDDIYEDGMAALKGDWRVFRTRLRRAGYE